MVLELPSPGVQDPGEAGQITADIPGIPCQFFDGSGSRRKQRLVGKTLMAAAKRPHLFGHGEGEHEVLARQPAAQLALQPVPAFLVLTLGTVAVTAGPVDMMGRAAALAAVNRDPEVARAAVDDGLDITFLCCSGRLGKRSWYSWAKVLKISAMAGMITPPSSRR